MAEVSLKCANGLSWFLDMPTPTSLDLNSDDTREPRRGPGRGGLAVLVVLLALALGGLGFVQYRTLQQLTAAEQQAVASALASFASSTSRPERLTVAG